MEERCIIHFDCYDNTEEPLTTPKDFDSWTTILHAAQVRNHDPILKAAEGLPDGKFPPIKYHRRCRSRFTLKRDLEVISRKNDPDAEVHSDELAAKRPKRAPSTSGARVYIAECIFCGKDRRMKGTSTRERLVQVSQLKVDDKLRECAIAKQDDKMIGLTSRDIVAAEAHYHRSCYREYTRPVKLSETNQQESPSPYAEVQTRAFNELLNYIRDDVIPNKNIIPLAKLSSRMEDVIRNGGLDITASTKKNIRRRLQNELGEEVQFVTDDNGKLLVVPGNITVADMVLANQRLQRELNVLRKSSAIDDIIDQAAIHVRTSIKNDFVGPSWPYHPNDINTDHIELPSLVERLVRGVITGQSENLNMSNRMQLSVQSICQDIIYATTRGHQKPSKHILLPYAVKTLTGNVELIQMLNRLGHGISYHQLEEIETALCLQKLAAGSQSPVLPAALQPTVFTNVAWDNIDRLEETLTGEGTSHRVNGIAVQAVVYGPHLPKPALPPVEKTRQRTITVEPTELEPYIAGKRLGPHPLPATASSEDCLSASTSKMKNLLWVIERQINKENQTIASWTGFNIQCRGDVETKKDILCYLPTINSPATQMNTILEIVKKTEDIRVELQLPTIVLVADQAVYAKVAEVVWRYKEMYHNIVIRMGDFHTVCHALAVLGKRFQDAGLRDLCIEAGIVAQGSVNSVMEGRMYNRAVRVHKIVYEALMRLLWNQFVEHVMEGHRALLKTLLEQVQVLELDQKNITQILQQPDFIQLTEMWKEFLDYLRTSHGNMAKFWMSYVDFVEDILLGLLHASREGDWELHLHAIQALIPWSFAYDRVNYARYLSAYFAEMAALPYTHPDVHEEFKNGHFSVQMSDVNPFGGLPLDQALEMTVNRDTQTPGGTTKFSLQARAVQRHYITAEYRSAFLGQLRSMVSLNNENCYHKDFTPARVQKDEASVSAVVSVIDSWVNPFSEAQDIVSLSTAKAATPEVSTDLIKAREIGERNYKMFAEERLHQALPSTEFHATIKMNKLKTFSHLAQQKSVKLKNGQALMLKADRSLFGRIIVIAESRDLQMQDILSYPLGPIPWALATHDGLMRKTNKAALANTLKRNAALVEDIPSNSATVIDGMSLVHKMSGSPTTFGDVAEAIFMMALRQSSLCQRIDVVFDKYNQLSVKNLERQLRGEEHGRRLQNIAPSQLVRQWRAFLSQTSNKANLIEFLVRMWRQEQYRCKLGNKLMYVTVGDECFVITKDGSEEVEDLKSTQEEADGRLLLHTAHAAKNGYRVVVICAEDTDVFVLSLAFSSVIGCQILLRSGTKNRTNITDIQAIASNLGEQICRGLIGMHAFTGCDSVSAFAGKGKTSALKLLKTSTETQECFVELGQEWNVAPELVSKLEKVVCQLYSPNTTVQSVNDLRYHLFCARKGEIESHQLPPSQACLKKHIQRANYQAAIWRHCLEPCPEIPSPVGHGWKIEADSGQEQLAVVWMDDLPAPEAVLDLLACRCPTRCTAPTCKCVANGLKCTDMCRLKDCQNRSSEEHDIEEELVVADPDDDQDD